MISILVCVLTFAAAVSTDNSPCSNLETVSIDPWPDKFFPSNPSLSLESEMASSDIPNAQLLDFTCNLYRTIAADSEEDRNVILSPLSVSLALGMTLAGSAGNSEKQLATCLRYTDENPEGIHEIHSLLLKSLHKCSHQTSLFIANYMFPDDKFPIFPSFHKSIEQHYYTTVQTLDFQSKADKSRLIINRYISEATHDKIKDLLQPGSVSSSTCMMLVNAIYFKSLWSTKFNPQLTQSDSFYISKDQTVEVPMMHQQNKFMLGISEQLQCSILELPYVDDNLSLVILLPLDVEGLSYVETHLNSASLHAAMSNLSKFKVSIYLPRFKLDERLSLKPILQKMGVTDIFDSDVADLSKMSSDSGLYVSAVEHQAVIEVNEEGTEAAAATRVAINKRSLEIIEEFKANRPFLFLLLEKSQNVILFLGSYKHPKVEAPLDVHEEL